MSRQLQEIVADSLTDDSFESRPTWCYRYVRQVRQAKFGDRFNEYDRPTAAESLEQWKHSPYAHDPKDGMLPNDIALWKGSPRQPAGHAAIVCETNRYGENSSSHVTKKWGAKGYRDRRKVRMPDLIVRLPVN